MVDRIRVDWATPSGRLTYATVPITTVALWLLGHLGVVAAQPLWLLALANGAGMLATTAYDVRFHNRPTPGRLHLRIAIQVLSVTVVMYLTGWGPTLAVGYVITANDLISSVGSRTWRPFVVWSSAGIAAGQTAIALGIAPSLIALPEVHGLAALAVIGTAFVVSLLGLRAGQVESAQRELRDSEERLRSTLETASEAYFELDETGMVTAWNAQSERTFGWTRDEALGRRFEELIMPPSDRSSTRAGFEQLAAGEGGDELFRSRRERLMSHRDGRSFPSEFAFWQTHTSAGRRFNAFAHDITERIRAEEALRDSEEGFRLLFERNPQPMWVYDCETLAILAVNDSAVAHYGYGRDEFLSMCITDIRPPEDLNRLSESIAGARDGVRHAGLWRHQTKTGLVIDVEITAHHLEFGGRSATLVMAQDVTDRLKAQRDLLHQAMHDALTGLPNRNLLLDRLGHAIARLERGNDRVAVIFVDLDRFKIINDGKGHSAGDRLLVEVAARLQRAVRPSDTVARLGRDEFVVILEGVADESEAMIASGRIARALERPFQIDGCELFVSASQGIALAEPAESPDEVLANADVAMYSAKDRGRGQTQIADEQLRTRASNRLETEMALREALERNEFVVHYQPVVSLSTGHIVGAEALVRWQRPGRGLVPPDQFIPAAEDSGLIVPIGEWVLQQALSEARTWDRCRAPGVALSVAVNLSTAQLRVPNLPFVVARALSSAGVAPSRLHLEITESVLMQDVEHCSRALDTLRELGVHVDVDDFGIGYSSLSYIQRLPIDCLKIDKSFVDRLSGPDRDSSIVSAVIGLGKSLNVSVVAEGVESAAQQSLLADLGCSLAQGFHFSRPVPTTAFTDLLRRGPFLTRAGQYPPTEEEFLVSDMTAS